MKGILSILGTALLAIVCVSCNSIQRDVAPNADHPWDSMCYDYASSRLEIYPLGLDYHGEAVRIAIVSSFSKATQYCIEVHSSEGGSCPGLFKKRSATEGMSQVTFSVSRSEWQHLINEIEISRLMSEPARLMPTMVGRPYHLWVELRTGHTYHVIDRDGPHQLHEERQMTALLSFCQSIITCADIPEADKTAMRQLLGEPSAKDEDRNRKR